MVSHIDAIRDLQALSRKYPKAQPVCDRAITALIVLADRLHKYEVGK